MEGKSVCEQCNNEFKWRRFKNQTVARFCGKKCWYEWNAKNLAAFNDNRFSWKTATEDEKLERLKRNFEMKVIRKEGCWDWKGVFDKNGYGLIAGNFQRMLRASRVSWMIHKGKIPKGIVICHSCDNVRCTNPDHLFLGTPKINSEDMAKKGRSTRGEKNNFVKLKESDIPQIREMLKKGMKIKMIAASFHVEPSTITAIKFNKSWAHIEENKITEKDGLRKKGGLAGQFHPSAKINEKEVKEIKKLLSMGVKSCRIAKDFNVSNMIIYNIKSGKTWNHIKIGD